MTILFTSLSFLGYCFLIKKQTRWPIESMPFFIVSFIVVVFYFLTFIDCLHSGSLVFILLGMVLFFTVPFPVNASDLFSNYFTPGFVLWMLLTMVFGIMAHYATFADPDDYFIWIPHAKFLYYDHRFLLRDDVVANVGYPPGGSLLAYFFLRLNQFSDQILFYTQLFFIFSPLVILLRNFSWIKWHNALLAALLIITLFIFYFDIPLGFQSTTLMDMPVGLFFGGILASYFLMQNEKRVWLYLLFPAVAMVLFRPLIYPFVLLLTIIIITDQLYIKKSIATHQNTTPLSYLAMMIAPLIVWYTWTIHMRQAHTALRWSWENFFHAIYNHQSSLNSLEFYRVLSIYFHNTLKSLTLVSIILLIGCYLMTQIDNRNLKIRLLKVHIILLIGFIFYLSMLLCSYLYQMYSDILFVTPNMETKLSSYDRFTNTYLLGWLIFLLSSTTFLKANKIKQSIRIEWLKYTTILILFALITIHNINLFPQVLENKLGGGDIWHNQNFVMAQTAKEIISKKINATALVGMMGNAPVGLATSLLPIRTRIININTPSKNPILEQIVKYPYLLVYDNEVIQKSFPWIFSTLRENQTPIVVNLCLKSVFVNGKFNCLIPVTRKLYVFKIKKIKPKVELTLL